MRMLTQNVIFEFYADDCGFTYQIPRKQRRKKKHPKTMFCPVCDRDKTFIKI